MNSPSSPAGGGQHPAAYAAHAAGAASWPIGAETRQEAQEADANMAWDEWRYAPASLENMALPVAESDNLLP